MSKPPTGKIVAPIAVIVAAAVAAVVGTLVAAGIFSSAEHPASAPSDAQSVFADAPPGASPPSFKGSPQARVALEEFIDFQCDACRSKHPVMKAVAEAYGDRIYLVVRHFPVGDRPRALDAALAAEAAGLQGRFWEMKDRLFDGQSDWSTSDDHRKFFTRYAREMGLDVERFEADLGSAAVRARVDADIERGKAAGVRSTPSLFIDAMPVPFRQIEAETLKNLIDSRLSETSR